MKLPQDNVLVFSAYADDLPVRIYQSGWQPLNNPDSVLGEYAGDLRQLLDQCRLYLR